jgi:hypothetical protein
MDTRLMNTYPVGVSVQAVIQFLDSIGNALVPTALSYQVLDENELVIKSPVSQAFTTGDTKSTIAVAPSYNTLAAGATNGLRIVELDLTTADGSIYALRYTYALGVTDQLVLLTNSFQTLAFSMLEASNLPASAVTAYSGATDALRIPAMAEAYQRLTRLGYFVRWPRDVDAQNYLTEWEFLNNRIISPRFWQVMTLDTYLNLYPEHFRMSLRRAQIVEANVILGGDPVSDTLMKKRRDGILSEDTGQSKMMFRSSKPLDIGISRAALSYLTLYIDMRQTMTRS